MDDFSFQRLRRLPWRDVLDALRAKVQCKYDCQFAELAGLSPETYSRIKNKKEEGGRRWGKPQQPENIKKIIVTGFILAGHPELQPNPDHPPAIRTDSELDTVLDTVPYREFWPVNWDRWVTKGKPWVRGEGIKALDDQRRLWPVSEAAQGATQAPSAVPATSKRSLTEEAFTRLVQIRDHLDSIIEDILEQTDQ